MERLAVIKQLRAAGVECFTRDEWGTVRSSEYIKRRRTHPMPSGPANYHFLHITVTNDTDSVLEGKAGARQIESFGLSSPPMVSYQDLVTNEGKYFQGQDYGTKGTHTINDKGIKGFPNDLNLQGYALAIMQNVEDEVSDVQVELIAKVFAARELAGYVKKGANVYPHRTFAYKACPGDKAVARLPEIVRRKNELVKAGSIKGKAPIKVVIPPKPPTRQEIAADALERLKKADSSGNSRGSKLLRTAKQALNKMKPAKKR